MCIIKKALLLISLSYLGFNSVIAQPLSFEFWGGVSSYQGDIQTKLVSAQSSPLAVGLGISLPISQYFSISSQWRAGRLQGDDQNSSDVFRQRRNLNFRTSIYEWGLFLKGSLFRFDTRRINPFLELGIAAFHFNPYTYDSKGVKHFLNPLGTEGQGLSTYPDRHRYSLYQVSIPLNFGINVIINDYTKIYWSIGWRKTFTDYIDDISKTYADPNELKANGLKALELAFRSNEVTSTATYPSSSFPRGNSKNMDGYFFTGFGISYQLTYSSDYSDNRTLKKQSNCPKF